jgi:hypothetical protein
MRQRGVFVALLCVVGALCACSGGARDWRDGDGEPGDTDAADPARDGLDDGDDDTTSFEAADVPDADEALDGAGDGGVDGDSIADGDLSDSAEGDASEAGPDATDEDSADTCDAAWRPAPPCEPAIPCRWDLGESDCYAACGFANFDPDTGRTICGCPTRDGGKPCTGLPGECEAHCTPQVPISFPACSCDGCPCGYCEFWNPASTCACMGDGSMVCP